MEVIDRRMKYYLAHKDDEEYKKRVSASKAKYYQKNKEKLIQKSSERYYRLKNMVQGI